MVLGIHEPVSSPRAFAELAKSCGGYNSCGGRISLESVSRTISLRIWPYRLLVNEGTVVNSVGQKGHPDTDGCPVNERAKNLFGCAIPSLCVPAIPM